MSDPRFEQIGSPETRVMEECSEVIHAICKAQRFGWKNWHPDTPSINNARLVLNELDDLRRAVNLLEPLLKAILKKEEEEHG